MLAGLFKLDIALLRLDSIVDMCLEASGVHVAKHVPMTRIQFLVEPCLLLSIS